ncbi:MAG: adenylate kinase family protein [Methanobacteriota archaeon]
MLIALTGTPGTGKSTIANELAERGYQIIKVNDTIDPYVLEKNDKLDTRIVDTDRWSAEFPFKEGIVEGHLSHLLPVERVIVLRCRPDVLKSRLIDRGYHQDKVAENVEAEMLDVILIEALEEHTPELIYEIDATDMSVPEVADMLCGILAGNIPPGHGSVDWLSICADLL